MDKANDHIKEDEALQSSDDESPQPPPTKKAKTGKEEHKKCERPTTPPISRKYTQLTLTRMEILNHI